MGRSGRARGRLEAERRFEGPCRLRFLLIGLALQVVCAVQRPAVRGGDGRAVRRAKAAGGCGGSVEERWDVLSACASLVFRWLLSP